MSGQKRMGGMKLGQFGGVRSQPSEQLEQEIPATPPGAAEAVKVEAPATAPPKAKAKRKAPDKLTNVNIKISRNQQRWLQDTAQQVRDNNSDPVPPDQRVYPQHLIGVAIDLLKSQGIDWSEVRNAEELRDRLNL